MKGEADQAGQALRNVESSRGALFQLDGVDPKLGDRFWAMGGAATRDEAQDAAFAIFSAGEQDSLATYAQLQGLTDPVAIAKSVAFYKASFGTEAGGTEEILSKALAVAGKAPADSDASILAAAAKAAPAAKRAGLTDEETLAAVGAGAMVGPASESATQFVQLLDAFGRMGVTDRLKGQGLRAMIDDVAGRGWNQEQMIREMGSQQALASFTNLQTYYDQMLSGTTGATPAVLQDVLAKRDADPAANASRQARISAAQSALARDPMAVMDTVAQASYEEILKENQTLPGGVRHLANFSEFLKSSLLPDSLYADEATFMGIQDPTRREELRGAFNQAQSMGTSEIVSELKQINQTLKNAWRPPVLRTTVINQDGDLLQGPNG